MADRRSFIIDHDGSTRLGLRLAELPDGSVVHANCPPWYVDVPLTVDTNAYAAGDVLADVQVVANATIANDVGGWCVAAELLDGADQTEFDWDLFLLKANQSLGTENLAIDLTDTEALDVLRVVRYRVADNPSVDLIASKQYNLGPNHKDMPAPIMPATGTNDIYVGLVLRSGTPTFAADSLNLRLWFRP